MKAFIKIKVKSFLGNIEYLLPTKRIEMIRQKPNKSVEIFLGPAEIYEVDMTFGEILKELEG